MAINDFPLARQAVIVLGMHRSGTSALTGILAKLGVRPPNSLMPATPDNPKGYWESRELMRFHDRILESAGSEWSDWDEFNPDWMDSPDGQRFTADVSRLLETEFEDAPLLLIKDPRMCRMFPAWLTALRRLGIMPKVIMPVRHPAEVAKSLQDRDHLTPSQSKLLWLRHVLDAEVATRGLPRTFVVYPALLQDWRGELNRVSRTLDIQWPRQSAAANAEIEAYLAPELRHHVANEQSVPTPRGISAWAVDVYESLRALVGAEESPEILVKLDHIRDEFNTTSAFFAPVVHEQRQQFAEATRALEESVSSVSSEHENLSHLHMLLKQENVANYRLYDESRKAMEELRANYHERETAMIAMSAKYEVAQKELTSRLRESESQRADLRMTTDALGEEVLGVSERLRAALEQAGQTEALVETVVSLRAEIRRLTDDTRLADESLQERFAETAQLSRLVLELEETVAKQKASFTEQCAELKSRHAHAERVISQRDTEIRTQTLAAEAQGKLLIEYRATLEGIYSSRYWRAASGLRKIGRFRGRRAPSSDNQAELELLRGSNLFDRRWYLERYPDVRSSGVDPVIHYLQHGAREGRDPSAAFSTSGYISRYPDVATAGLNPLVHYINYGLREGRAIGNVVAIGSGNEV